MMIITLWAFKRHEDMTATVLIGIAKTWTGKLQLQPHRTCRYTDLTGTATQAFQRNRDRKIATPPALQRHRHRKTTIPQELQRHRDMKTTAPQALQRYRNMDTNHRLANSKEHTSSPFF